MSRHEWLLKRNCSLSPRQLGAAYAALCALSFLVAMIFIWHGAWMILVFSILEMLIVAAAFLHYARHATDHEHIALAEDGLLIERMEAGHLMQLRLDPRWTRIAPPRDAKDLICLQSKDVQIDVGRFVNDTKRRQVAKELQQVLRSAAPLPC